MRHIDILRKKLDWEVFTLTDIRNALGPNIDEYSTIKRLVKAKHILRLKRGLYVFGPHYQKKAISQYNLANIMYGPSYVSLHSMLSFYGLIPEAVVEIGSVNTKKTKLFHTSVARFRYRVIPHTAFPLGVTSIECGESRFIGATAEKALLDTLYLSGQTELYQYAIESLRIEHDDCKDLNLEHLVTIGEFYNRSFSERVNRLVTDINKGCS